MTYKAQSGGHSKHILTYHLMWVVKYRRTVLTREVVTRLKELIAEIAKEIDCELLAVEDDVDHFHVLIRLKPTHQLSKVVQRLKGKSAYVLFREFKWIKNRLWGGHLWSPSYYVVTVGGATIDTVKKYIESQHDK
jgi:putative transposase